MKIVKVVVIDDAGVEHTWIGEGSTMGPRSSSKLGQPYVQTVDVHLVLPAKEGVRA